MKKNNSKKSFIMLSRLLLIGALCTMGCEWDGSKVNPSLILKASPNTVRIGEVVEVYVENNESDFSVTPTADIFVFAKKAELHNYFIAKDSGVCVFNVSSTSEPKLDGLTTESIVVDDENFENQTYDYDGKSKEFILEPYSDVSFVTAYSKNNKKIEPKNVKEPGEYDVTITVTNSDYPDISFNLERKLTIKSIPYEIKFKMNDHTTTVKTLRGDKPKVPSNEEAQKYAPENTTFLGWSPKITSAKKDITYTAQYKSNLYNITFDMNGTKVTVETLPGTRPVPPTIDTIQDHAPIDTMFQGWSPEITDATADTTYTAMYR